MGVDHRRHGIGGIVKAVDELEAESDHQGDAQKKKGQDAFDRRARRLDVAVDAIGREEQAAAYDAQKNDDGPHVDRMIELGLRTFGLGR